MGAPASPRAEKKNSGVIRRKILQVHQPAHQVYPQAEPESILGLFCLGRGDFEVLEWLQRSFEGDDD